MFCRFGLRVSRAGEWEADPEGCPAQLPAGEVAAHEAACGFELLRCPFAGCGAQLRRSALDAHDVAEALQHARGERQARLALEKSSAARISAIEASCDVRFAALEAALAAFRSQDGAAAQAGPLPAFRVVRSIEHEVPFRACALSPDGALIASASGNELKLWRTATGECVRTFEGHDDDAINCCAFSPDGTLVLTGSHDHGPILWRTASGEIVQTRDSLDGYRYEYLWGCAWRPDGQTFLITSGEASLGVWNAMTGAHLCDLDCHLNEDAPGHIVFHGCFSPDGVNILSCGQDNKLNLWRTETKEMLQTYEGHDDDVNCCAFSPDGSQIVSASDDHSLKLWRTSTGECIRTFNGHTWLVRWCAFSPDGTLILSASNDCTLKLWRAATGECVQTLEGHTSNITSCAFSRDGAQIISSSGDNTIKIWAA